MESIRDQLSKYFSRPQLIQFVTLQVQQLIYMPKIKQMRKYLLLTFNVPSKTEKFDFQLQSNLIQFVLVLGKGYPCTAPRLFVKTPILSPGFNDCRNLLYDVIKCENWSFKISLKDIQEKIMVFLENLKSQTDNIFYMSRLGQFSLNSIYPIDLIKQIRGQINFVFEYDSFNALKMYVIDISSTHIAFFLTKQQPSFENGSLRIPNQKDVTSCMLIFYAQLGSISSLNVNRENFNDIQINFACKKPQSQTSVKNTVKKINSRKGGVIIKKILKNIKNYNNLDIRLQPNKQLVLDQEKINLSIIDLAEKQLTHKFNERTVGNLCQCYQKAIEYYEGNNIPYYQIFVDKISQLYQRPDVRLIMSSQKQFEDTTNVKT